MILAGKCHLWVNMGELCLLLRDEFSTAISPRIPSRVIPGPFIHVFLHRCAFGNIDGPGLWNQPNTTTLYFVSQTHRSTGLGVQLRSLDPFASNRASTSPLRLQVQEVLHVTAVALDAGQHKGRQLRTALLEGRQLVIHLGESRASNRASCGFP